MKSTTYIALLRGINVGGKNTVSMSKLKEQLSSYGYNDVVSYINSGNLILRSSKSAKTVRQDIEKCIINHFTLDSKHIKTLVLSVDLLQRVVENKPEGFGEKPDIYNSDAVFLIDLEIQEALRVFSPREGVDKIWQGDKVVYSQRLTAERTKSRLSKIIGTKEYESMTIRNWNTTTKLLTLAQKADSQ